MTALSSNYARRRLGDDPQVQLLTDLPVAAAAHLYAGAMVALNQSGYVVRASADASLRVLGITEDEVDNSTGSAGDLDATRVTRGVFLFVNSGTTDAVSDADIGRPCYVVDDATVARTSNGGARPAAGRVAGMEGSLVAVELGLCDPQSDADVMLLAGADLSAAQYHFVDLNSSGAAVLAGDGGRVCGVLQNAPASGAVAIVRPVGCGRLTNVIAGGSVTNGSTIASNASGRAKAATTGRTDTSDAGASNDPTIGSYAAGVLVTAGTGNGNTSQALLCISGAIPQTAA